MKPRFVVLIALCTTIGLSACQNGDNARDGLTTQINKISYSIGYSIGRNYRKNDVHINANLIKKGILDAMNGKKSPLTDTQMKNEINIFQNSVYQHNERKRERLAKKDLNEGVKFMAENKTKPGVITTKSGLEYKILRKGHGPNPKANSLVSVDYIGKLLNGKVIADTYHLGNLKTLHVNHVIPGMSEAFRLMSPGAKWRLFIPPKLAYGPEGAGKVIPPNSVIIYDLVLHSFKKP